MATYFQATQGNVIAFIKSLEAVGDLEFNEVIQRAYVIAATHATEEYPATAFIDGLAKLGFGRGAALRYIAGTATPHKVIHARVYAFVRTYLLAAVTARREQDQRISDALSAHNLSIQQPGYDSEGFFKTANAEGIGAALSASIEGKFSPKPDGQ